MNQVDMKKAELLLSKAKIDLMTNSKLAFFSVLAMNMRYRWSMDVPRACTNGRSIILNPQAWIDLPNNKQRLSRLMHEVTHCSNNHIFRRGARDPKKWNYAIDYYTNLMLTDHGFEKIETWLWDEKYRGLSGEEIFATFPQDFEIPGFDDFDLSDEPDPDDNGQSTPDMQRFEMDKLLLQAAMHAQKTGGAAIPSDVALYLDQWLNPKLPWHVILRRWFGKYSKTGFSWSRRNRRFSDAYLPSRHKPSLANAAFATDISCSVSDDEYGVIASEVCGVFGKMHPDWITYIQFSDTITSKTKVRNARQLKAIEFVGRGGTSVADLFDWADEEKPTVLVVLTDGGIFDWGKWETKQPACDIVWLIHDNPDWIGPYGKTIHYEISNG